MRLALVCVVVAVGLASSARAQPSASDRDACGRAAFDAAEPGFHAFEGVAIAGATPEQLIDASERLVAYGATEVAQCVDDQRAHDATFAAFAPRDLEPLVK